MVMAPVELWIAAVASVSATHRPALQQPDQAGLVVARQAAVARVRLSRAARAGRTGRGRSSRAPRPARPSGRGSGGHPRRRACQRSTGTSSGQRVSRAAKVRPKRFKRPKGGLLSLLSLLSRVPWSAKRSRIARYLPMGALHREPRLDGSAARRSGSQTGRGPWSSTARAPRRCDLPSVPPKQIADRGARHSIAARLMERSQDFVGRGVPQ